MANIKSEAPKKTDRKRPEVELVSDAWPKFERFIRDVAKAGPQHRKSKSAGKLKAKTRTR